MGKVYKARDTRLNRTVALKLLRMEDPALAPRMMREARAQAQVNHPHVCKVYEVGEEGGMPYIALEFIRGKPLDEACKEMSLEGKLKLMKEVCEALHSAHVLGIIHRDIKPANILLRGPDGAAKIADFGVARLLTSDLTQSGASLGSPAYMSPEQIRWGTLDGRSDLFSLAAVLYEALAGKRPFQGEDLASLVYSIAHETPIPIRRRVRSLPRTG